LEELISIVLVGGFLIFKVQKKAPTAFLVCVCQSERYREWRWKSVSGSWRVSKPLPCASQKPRFCP